MLRYKSWLDTRLWFFLGPGRFVGAGGGALHVVSDGSRYAHTRMAHSA